MTGRWYEAQGGLGLEVFTGNKVFDDDDGWQFAGLIQSKLTRKGERYTVLLCRDGETTFPHCQCNSLAEAKTELLKRCAVDKIEEKEKKVA